MRTDVTAQQPLDALHRLGGLDTQMIDDGGDSGASPECSPRSAKMAASPAGSAAEAAAAAAGFTGDAGAAGSSSWTFVQSFGDDAASADDLVTSLEFSADGRWLAAGDEAGRVCIFQEAPAPSGRDTAADPRTNYDFWFEFQSHERVLDPLKSKLIPERVRQLRFLDAAPGGRPGPSRSLLAANTKVIKLWRLSERGGGPAASERRVYANAHSYDIHSLDACPDGETFLSADDLRVNIWHVERAAEAFVALDTKPAQLGDLDEVLTTASFHPTDCGVLATGTSAGAVRVYDTRARAVLGRPEVEIRNATAPADPALSQYAGVASSVTHASFVAGAAGGGRTLLTRDFLSVKTWDVRHAARPLSEVSTHSYLSPYLSQLYENGCLFDSFSAGVSPCGTRAVTGSYGNRFVVHDVAGGPAATGATGGGASTLVARDEAKGGCTLVSPDDSDATDVDLARKSLHTRWHPKRDAVAVAAVNKIYIYEDMAQHQHPTTAGPVFY